MKQVWQADDGLIFTDENDCANYENEILSIEKLHTYLCDRVIWEYDEDIGSHVIYKGTDLARFIITNFTEIKNIVNPT